MERLATPALTIRRSFAPKHRSSGVAADHAARCYRSRPPVASTIPIGRSQQGFGDTWGDHREIVVWDWKLPMKACIDAASCAEQPDERAVAPMLSRMPVPCENLPRHRGFQPPSRTATRFLEPSATMPSDSSASLPWNNELLDGISIASQARTAPRECRRFPAF